MLQNPELYQFSNINPYLLTYGNTTDLMSFISLPALQQNLPMTGQQNVDPVLALIENSNPNIGMLTEGAVNAGKIQSTPELENHLKNRQLVNKNGKPYNNSKGIVGAHNSNEFYANDVKVRNTKKIYDVNGNEVKGVIEVEYSMPELDKTGKPTGKYNDKTFTKTIYDPDATADTTYVNRGIEAANNALANEPSGVLPRTWIGVDSEGVKWTGNFEDGEITSMWPTN
jgi:hypothetical protein